MNGHTKGPWSVAHFALPQDRECKDLLTGKPSRPCQCGYVFGNNDQHGAVATVHYKNDDNPSDENPPKHEATANARLIAAAPELYDALRWALEYIADGTSVEEGETPEHDCGFKNRPDEDHCDFHDRYFSARAVLAAAVPPSTEK